MNEKIDKNFNSSEFINKVVFFLLLLVAVIALAGDLFIIKDFSIEGKDFSNLNITMLSYPWITAGSINYYIMLSGITETFTVLNYLSPAISILFSSIVIFIIIPFAFAFSVSPAVKAIKQRTKETILFKNFAVINFFISSIFIFVFSLSLIIQYYSINTVYDEVEMVTNEQTVLDLGYNEITDLTLNLRQKWLIEPKNDGLLGEEKKNFNGFKQKIVNILNNSKFEYIKNLSATQISDTSIILTAQANLSDKIKTYEVEITQNKHKIILR